MSITCGTLSVLDLTGCYKNNSGGISECYIAYLSDLTGSCYTVSTGNTLLITDIQTSGKVFYKYKPSRYSSNWTEVTPDSETNTVFEQTATLVFPKRSGEQAFQMKIVAQSLTVLIIRDSNSKYFLIGAYNGLSAAPSYDSGKALTDNNATTLVLKGVESSPSYEVSASIINGLVNMV